MIYRSPIGCIILSIDQAMVTDGGHRLKEVCSDNKLIDFGTGFSFHDEASLRRITFIFCALIGLGTNSLVYARRVAKRYADEVIATLRQAQGTLRPKLSARTATLL